MKRVKKKTNLYIRVISRILPDIGSSRNEKRMAYMATNLVCWGPVPEVSGSVGQHAEEDAFKVDFGIQERIKDKDKVFSLQST